MYIFFFLTFKTIEVWHSGSLKIKDSSSEVWRQSVIIISPSAFGEPSPDARMLCDFFLIFFQSFSLSIWICFTLSLQIQVPLSQP